MLLPAKAHASKRFTSIIILVDHLDIAIEIFRVRLKYFPLALCRLYLLDKGHTVETYSSSLFVFTDLLDFFLLNAPLLTFILFSFFLDTGLEFSNGIEELDDSTSCNYCQFSLLFSIIFRWYASAHKPLLLFECLLFLLRLFFGLVLVEIARFLLVLSQDCFISCRTLSCLNGLTVIWYRFAHYQLES